MNSEDHIVITLRIFKSMLMIFNIADIKTMMRRFQNIETADEFETMVMILMI